MADENRDPKLLFQPFRELLAAGLDTAHAQGLDVYVFEGWRSPSRQADLFALGRTVPGKIVTDAKAWDSWHQYGVAVDLVFGGPGKWTWDGDYQKLGPIMEVAGLEWAGRWKRFPETPHFQWTAGMAIDKAKTIAMVKGVLGVWEAIGATVA